MRVVLSFGPLTPCLAALAVPHLSGQRVPWPLVSDSLPPLSFALPYQPSPPDHFENHLIWLDSIKVIPLAWCRMSLEHLVGAHKIPTTVMILLYQTVCSRYCNVILKGSATWAVGEPLGKKGGWGGRRFSLTPTRVGSRRGLRHGLRRGFPSKYKRECEGKVAKREVKGSVCRHLLDTG